MPHVSEEVGHAACSAPAVPLDVTGGGQVAQPLLHLGGLAAQQGGQRVDGHRGVERHLTKEEVQRIADAVPDGRYRALVLTLAWTGLRIGEAAALRLPNLDLLRARITVVEAPRW